MSLATRCPACGTIFRVVQDQLKVSEGWVRCGQCHEVFHGIEALFDLDSDPAIAARRAATRQAAAPPPTRVFAEQRAAAPIPLPAETQTAPAPSPIATPKPPSAPATAAPQSVPATPSAFGTPGLPPPPPAIRPGYTGFTPATRPMQAPPAPVVPARSPIPAVATRGTIAPRFAARLAEESARAQVPPAEAMPVATPPAPTAVPTPAPAPLTPLVTPIAGAASLPVPSAAELASEFAAAATPPATAAPKPAPITTREAEAVVADVAPAAPSADDAEDDPRAGPPTLASMLPEDAGEWPPRRTRKRAAAAEPASSEIALVDRTKDPRFLREARSGARWRRPWVRAVLSVSLLLLIVAAVGQVAWPMRDSLAARWPATRPAWDWLCEQAGCRIEPPRAIASLALDGSSLTRTDTEHVLLFSADLHNRADHEVRVPSFDVTFMDLNGEIVARKVLTPEQIGIHQAALPPEGELHVHARLQVGSLPASGFQADLFYP
jgi:predicted Zn finger-like uncharacterized protein